MQSHLEPALIDWSLNGRPTEHGWRATVLDLGRRGHLRIEPVQQPEAGSRTRVFTLARTQTTIKPWEAIVLELVFGEVGKGEEQVSTGALWSWFANREHGCRRWWSAWSQLVAREAERRLLPAAATGGMRGLLAAHRRERELHEARKEAALSWQAYGDHIAGLEVLPDGVADELDRWAATLCSAIPVRREERIARLLDEALDVEARRRLTEGWCPLGPPDESITSGLWALQKALPGDLLAGA